MNKRIVLVSVLFLVLFYFIADVAAQEEEITLQGLELEKVLIFLNAFISLFLFILTVVAYRRDGRKRFLYIGLAFLLFSIKNFLISSELFTQEIPFLDPLSVVFEFLALVSFFYGVIKK
ncbi:MAG: hypothetical protein AABY05_02795 [Nanoarchaeota archaeon]